MDLINRYLLILILSYCGLAHSMLAQNFEIYKSDTINKTDVSDKKQGHWIIFFANSKKIEAEGNYENNRKTGTWKTYYQNGNLKSEIPYQNNQPDGYSKMYYESGKISEEGNWKGTKWTGNYNYYYPNGQKAYEWNFNENGSRTGVQKYYYESGKLLIKGEWKNGKENGTITEYYENGSIKNEKNYAEGEFNSESSKYYTEKKVTVNDIPDDKIAVDNKNQVETNITTNNENKIQPFDGNGFHKLYNAFKKLDREGEFQNGQLVSGKRYYYNSDGKLIKTVIYKNGAITETIKEN